MEIVFDWHAVRLTTTLRFCHLASSSSDICPSNIVCSGLTLEPSFAAEFNMPSVSILSASPFNVSYLTKQGPSYKLSETNTQFSSFAQISYYKFYQTKSKVTRKECAWWFKKVFSILTQRKQRKSKLHLLFKVKKQIILAMPSLRTHFPQYRKVRNIPQSFHTPQHFHKSSDNMRPT